MRQLDQLNSLARSLSTLTLAAAATRRDNPPGLRQPWCADPTAQPCARRSLLSARASLRVLAIAVLGKHGNPLFLKSYSARQGGAADLKWHYAAHTSLDFFEERGEPNSWGRLDPPS